MKPLGASAVKTMILKFTYPDNSVVTLTDIVECNDDNNYYRDTRNRLYRVQRGYRLLEIEEIEEAPGKNAPEKEGESNAVRKSRKPRRA